MTTMANISVPRTDTDRWLIVKDGQYLVRGTHSDTWTPDPSLASGFLTPDGAKIIANYLKASVEKA